MKTIKILLMLLLTITLYSCTQDKEVQRTTINTNNLIGKWDYGINSTGCGKNFIEFFENGEYKETSYIPYPTPCNQFIMSFHYMIQEDQLIITDSSPRTITELTNEKLTLTYSDGAIRTFYKVN